jgi:hypothetical protein
MLFEIAHMGKRICHTTFMMFCGIPYFVDKNMVTQGCNQGMRPNAAKCGYNTEIRKFTEHDRARRGTYHAELRNMTAEGYLPPQNYGT